ncbi:MAG: HlyD family secretion protein, partial [Phycisphaerae bacterium]
MSTFTKSPVSVGHGSAARGGLFANRRVVTLVVGIAILAVGYAAFSWLDVASWFRREAAETSVHIVQSATLSIVISEDGELKPKDQIEIKNEVEGQSTILSIVAESTRVKKGDLLVELASDQLTERLETEKIELRRVEADAGAASEELEITRNQNASDLKKAELELEVAELELNKYTHGDYPKEVKTLEIEVERAELDQLRKRDELTKQEKLLVKGFVTQSKLEELRFELKNADRTLEKNILALKTLNEYELTKNMKQKTSDAERAREELQRVQKRGASKEKQAEVRLEQSQSTLQVRRTRLDRLIEQVGKCKTIAPVDGVVQYKTSPWDDFRPAQGQKVHEGQTLCVLPDTSQMIVSFRIHEGDRHRVKDGMPCVVRVTAVPGKTFTGKISKIARFADSANRWINPDLKE